MSPISDLDRANSLISILEEKMRHPPAPGRGTDSPGRGQLYTGVDLGTAYIVLTVVDEEKRPVAGALTWAQVVRDGLVVDYLGAVDHVRKLKADLEGRLGRTLDRAAVSYPPGTGRGDIATHRHVVEAAGMEVCGLVDEPTAANSILGVRNGAVVDIGGGTTGIAIVRDGEVVYTADEPTGGTHFTLVLAGAYRLPFEEAEELKKTPARQAEILPVVTPVIQKVATIVRNHLSGHPVDAIYLVGGTCCLPGLERIIERELGIPTRKPENPLLVTPLGIAMHCE